MCWMVVTNVRTWPTAAIQPPPPIGRLADTGDGALATCGVQFPRQRPLGCPVCCRRHPSRTASL